MSVHRAASGVLPRFPSAVDVFNCPRPTPPPLAKPQPLAMKPQSRSRPRPPPPPSALSPTWRHVARRAVGDDVDVLRAALLATEARRKRKLLCRERRALKKGVPGHRVRMRALERELRSWARSVEHYKAASLLSAAAGKG